MKNQLSSHLRLGLASGLFPSGFGVETRGKETTRETQA